MSELKAIETVYHGYRFRSRLEARWGVFFDTIGVPWEYEKEGFDLGVAGWYLPDFWLPEQRCWIEIKPVEPDGDTHKKLHALAQASGFDAYCFFGQIPLPEDEWGNFDTDADSAYIYESHGGWDNLHKWCICVHCGCKGIEYSGRSERLPCSCPASLRGHKDYTAGHPLLVAGYLAARQARFEKGGNR
jgi:hypothetical protein